MTKDVLITIRGSQLMNGENDDIEMIVKGTYYQKNRKHYLIYEEVLDGFKGVVKNVIKIQPDSVDIIKTGVTNVHMTFERNKKHLTCYATPLGGMMIGLNTREISVAEEEEEIAIRIQYSLDINYEHVSDCSIAVDVRSVPTHQD